jgi:uncharacterized protein (TIGR02147 family)
VINSQVLKYLHTILFYQSQTVYFLHVAHPCNDIFTDLPHHDAKPCYNLFMEQQLYYISKLKECLSLKQKDNAHYSLRAFSRDLDIHGSTMSQILNGKRGLPFKRANDVAQKLNLSPKEITLFMESFFRSKTNIDDIKIEKLDKRFILDESYFKAIAEWEHFAVLELYNLVHFDLSANGISNKLGIEKNRAEVVLDNLLKCGLIFKNDHGELERAHPDIKTTEDITSSALKKSHKETLEMGINKLEEIEVELRDFSSATVAVDLDKLPEAKTIIREFRQKMTALLRDGRKTDVYQLAIQFYPLTEINKQELIQ